MLCIHSCVVRKGFRLNGSAVSHPGNGVLIGLPYCIQRHILIDGNLLCVGVGGCCGVGILAPAQECMAGLCECVGTQGSCIHRTNGLRIHLAGCRAVAIKGNGKGLLCRAHHDGRQASNIKVYIVRTILFINTFNLGILGSTCLVTLGKHMHNIVVVGIRICARRYRQCDQQCLVCREVFFRCNLPLCFVIFSVHQGRIVENGIFRITVLLLDLLLHFILHSFYGCVTLIDNILGDVFLDIVRCYHLGLKLRNFAAISQLIATALAVGVAAVAGRIHSCCFIASDFSAAGMVFRIFRHVLQGLCLGCGPGDTCESRRVGRPTLGNTGSRGSYRRINRCTYRLRVFRVLRADTRRRTSTVTSSPRIINSAKSTSRTGRKGFDETSGAFFSTLGTKGGLLNLALLGARGRCGYFCRCAGDVLGGNGKRIQCGHCLLCSEVGFTKLTVIVGFHTGC